MKFLSTWLRNIAKRHGLGRLERVLNEVPEHMAQEFRLGAECGLRRGESSMKFLSTWLRNVGLCLTPRFWHRPQ